MEIKNEQTLARILGLIEQLLALRIGRTTTVAVGDAQPAKPFSRETVLASIARDERVIREINAQLPSR